MKIYIGLENAEFLQVLHAVMPMMLPSFNRFESLRLALYIYLTKLRTNHTYEQIAPLFNISVSTVSVWIKKIRPLVHKAVVPLYLYNRSREELLNNTTPLSKKLYGVDDKTVIFTLDATYVFTMKSSNFRFQKQSYSMQFKRNLIKFMLSVTTNGLIAAAYGPFEAHKNDATIMEEIMNERGTIFEQLRRGDVVVVDRGFRDIISALKCIGLIVKVPKGTKRNKLTRADGNESRHATKTRFVVEARNSHIKNIWKYLNGTKIYQSIPNLKMDFQIGAALVNEFCLKVQSDEFDWNHIGDLMLSKTNQENILSNVVHRIPDTSFRHVTNLTLYPKLTYRELKEVSLGSYQIRLAKSYCQSHLRANNNSFIIKVCEDVDLCNRHFEKLLNGSKPLLLCLDLLSRFQSNKFHKTYVLLGFEKKYTVRGYCCSCRHGCRTVGCCSHVMLVIWFTLYIDQSTVSKLLPSSNLDQIFDNWRDEYVELE